MKRVTPNRDCPEPVYIYEDPSAHPIVLSGHFIDQKGAYRIHMMSTTPESLDRLCKVKTLQMDSNLSYSTAWLAGVNDFQRKVDVENMSDISDWWDKADSMAPTTPVCWLPGTLPFDKIDRTQSSSQTISPSIWCFDVCPECGSDATQYDALYAGWYFDCCRRCWRDNQYCTRPGMIIDGQHRIRGMAKVTGTNHHEQPIFASFLSEDAPGGVLMPAAAKLFIEINAGATPLDQLHENYLSSHFELFEYINANRRKAFEVGVKLNIPGAAANEWSEDIGRHRKVGRVSVMPNDWSVDYLDVSPMSTAGTIEEWVMRVVGESYDVPVIGRGGGSRSRTPYAWSPTIVRDLEQDLRNLISAATNIWPGARGAKTLAYWRTDRSARGYLQQKRVFRILMNMLPIISARIDEQGMTRDRVEMEKELGAINNVSFTGAWDQYLTGDAGINLVTSILTRLYENAPYATPPGYWITLPAWFGGPHDPIAVRGFNATTAQVEFTTETTCAVCPSGPITSAVSLIGVSEATITITNATTGVTYSTRPLSLKKTLGALNVVEYADLGITAPTARDVIEMEIEVSKKFSTAMISAAKVSDTV